MADLHVSASISRSGKEVVHFIVKTYISQKLYYLTIWLRGVVAIKKGFKSGDQIGKCSFVAIFEIYQAELQLLLKETGGEMDLMALRRDLRWADEKMAVGCGETWPLDEKGTDNYRSQLTAGIGLLARIHTVYGERMGYTSVLPNETKTSLAKWHGALEKYLASVIYSYRENESVASRLTTPYETMAAAVRKARKRSKRSVNPNGRSRYLADKSTLRGASSVNNRVLRDTILLRNRRPTLLSPVAS